MLRRSNSLVFHSKAQTIDSILLPLQCRAGRVLANLSIDGLAESSDVSAATVKRFEAGASCHPSTLRKLRSALELAGVVIIEDGEIHGPGGRPRGAGVCLSEAAWLQ
jgi:hypothetical protein